ncbi:hypothetical protein OHV52_03170 [Acinetobacter baumannii]|nr:hypothetical protein [Acinetobacter baumannii]MDC4524870.1 hypothetical protein [Acinetobacter baumannii]
MMRRLKQRQRQQRSILGMLSNHSKTGLSKKEVEFLKAYGLKKAREVVEGMPECANHYKFSEYASIDQYYSIHTIPLKWNNYSKTWYQLRKKPKDLVDLIDLKRLVESLDRVNEHGGYLAAKELLSFSIVHQEAFGKDAVSDENINLLKDSIKDHESIYGGGDE